MNEQYTNHSDNESVSYVQASARGMRKNYNLHVDSGYQSQQPKDLNKTAYGTGWVLLDANSPHLFDGVGVRAYWDQYIEHSITVELEGIYHALKTLKNNHYGIIHPTNHMNIYCDNKMAEYIMNRRLEGHKAPLYAFDVVERIMEFHQQIHMAFIWEKGHLDNTANNVADRLAFYARKDLERSSTLGVLHMELLLLDVLGKFGYHDEKFVNYIKDETRRQDVCRTHDAVELFYEIVLLEDGSRQAEWYAIHGTGLDVGSVPIKFYGGGMDMVQLASLVLDSYRESENFDESKPVYFRVPMNRTLIDGIISVHNGSGVPKDNRCVNAVTIMNTHFDSMNIHLVRDRNRKMFAN